MTNTITPSVRAKITWLNDDPAGAKKASASITIANAFQVHGVGSVEGPKGLFLSMPQRQTKDKDGSKKYVEIAHPVTAEMRKAINDAVFDAYSQTLAMSNQYKTDFQKNPSPDESNSPTESAKDNSLPFEVTSDDTSDFPDDDPEESEEESEDDVQAPIMGQFA